MPPLTESMIQMLLDRLQLRPLYEKDNVVLCERTRGWSDDPEIAATQAALSVMLARWRTA